MLRALLLLPPRASEQAAPQPAHPRLLLWVRPADLTSPNAVAASAACGAASGTGAAYAAPAAGWQSPGWQPRGGHDGCFRSSAEAPPLLPPLLVMHCPAADNGEAAWLGWPPKTELILRRPAVRADCLRCRNVRRAPLLLLLLLLLPLEKRSSFASSVAPRSPRAGMRSLAQAAASARTAADPRRSSETLTGFGSLNLLVGTVPKRY